MAMLAHKAAGRRGRHMGYAAICGGFGEGLFGDYNVFWGRRISGDKVCEDGAALWDIEGLKINLSARLIGNHIQKGAGQSVEPQFGPCTWRSQSF